jgi:hypothetical protein
LRKQSASFTKSKVGIGAFVREQEMDDKLKSLLSAAIQSSTDGRLNWTAFDDETFRAMIGPGTLRVRRGNTTAEWCDDYGESAKQYPAITYTVWVMNDRGQVIAESEVIEGQHAEFRTVDELFELARKSAFSSDRIIDEMLSLLQPSK